MAAHNEAPGAAARKAGLATTFEVAAWTKAAADALHGCGGGLYLRTRRTGGAWWIFRYRFNGARHDMGLGAYDATGKAGLTLAAARRALDEARAAVRAGRNPLAERRIVQAEAVEEAKAVEAQAEAVEVKAKRAAISFRDVAERHIARHEDGWRNAKHAAQWTSTLRTYAFPSIGDKAPAEITARDVLAIIEPLWKAKPETAARVRGRIETVLDAAKVEGLRAGENVAAWRGNLALLLPARAKVAPVEHHPALPWSELPGFLAALATKPGMAARALAFAILTAARSGEVRGTTWGEVDMPGALWTVPASRMKAGKAHRVPLSPAALAILADLRAALPEAPAADALIFPAPRSGGALSDMTMTKAIRDMDASARKAGGAGWRDAAGEVVTCHGMRSTFRDWAGEATHHPREVIEHALAHGLPSKVEAAYARGDLLAKRAALMADWAAFAVPPAKARKVVPIRADGGAA